MRELADGGRGRKRRRAEGEDLLNPRRFRPSSRSFARVLFLAHPSALAVLPLALTPSSVPLPHTVGPPPPIAAANRFVIVFVSAVVAADGVSGVISRAGG